MRQGLMRPGRGAEESADFEKIGALIFDCEGSVQTYGRFDSGSSAANLAFGQPLIYGNSWKAHELAGQLNVRQTACEEIIHRAN